MRHTSQSPRVFLFALGGLAGILLLAALALLFFVDAETYKPQFEAEASRALGMDVTVDGPLRIGFIPRLHVTLGGVHVRNGGSEIAFVKETEIAIELLPLFQRELRYSNIALNRARISIQWGSDGRYNFEKPAASKDAFHALELKRMSFTDLTIDYTDKKSGSGFESTNCNGELTDMRHPGSAAFLARLSFSGQFTCGEARGMGMTLSTLKVSVEATEGVFDFRPVTMRVFGGQGLARLRMDRSVSVPVLDASFTLTRFRIEEFFKALSPGNSVSGAMDFSTALTMHGRTRGELRRSASGEMSLSGNNLTLAGMDLDKQLSKYDSSQKFNLFDMTAFLLAGPVGLAVTKGYDFSSLVQQSGGSTQIRSVVSKWNVEKGLAHARDVALATPENRLALQGGLDFVDDEFADVTVALIDANGCATVRQQIHGPFSKPVVEKPNVLVALAGPVLGLLNKAKDLLPRAGGKCEVFYSGSLAPPK